ncbi:CBS domain-containing protein [Candidatus Woesearchaeota archaeon]|nr:CBS domain-containing protein [Candidatus Woesearchaeota archaeon]
MSEVRQIMSSNVATIEHSAKLTTAIGTMARNNYSTLVVTQKEKPIGILTETDMLHKVLRAGKDYKKLKVEDVMSSPILSISPTDSVNHIANVMVDQGVKSFPVFEKDRLVGIVTETDVVRETHKISEQYEHFMFRESVITWLVVIAIIVLIVIYVLQAGIVF